MINYRVARRYARALLVLAEEQQKLSVVDGDFERVLRLVNESRDLELFLQNPTISKKKKEMALTEVFSKMVDDLTLQFIALMVRKGRESMLIDTVDQFRRMVDEKMGIVRAEVRSVVSLNKRQEQQLKKQLEGFTGMTVEIQYSLDRSLRGGFLARMGDTVFDASVKRQLELLEKRFLSDGSVKN
jgi:F-type H+-transporting ATPase subunit delta